MKAQVRLRLGNLFDGPSDLVILPCDTHGGVTRFVMKSLRSYDLPWPKSMPLGQVEIKPLTGAEHIAQYVAFAASVDVGIVTPESAIRKIAEQVGVFATQQAAVRSVAVPLLGAGAGQLQSERVVSALRDGFVRTAPDGATLTIHILHAPVYSRLRGAAVRRSEETSRSSSELGNRRRVFFSYTDMAGNGDWVKSVATFLRQNGIDARLDRWHLRHGMELPQWMCNELALADKVVIVSDEAYAQKADGHQGGVGWETRIIQGDMLNSPIENTKYIVVVRGEEFSKSVPQYLQAKFSIHWPGEPTDSSKCNELISAVQEAYDVPEISEITVL